MTGRRRNFGTTESGSLYATFKIGEESPRFFKERPAGLCQTHAPLQSLKERVSHLLFKLPYLARQSRLRHAQSLGRPPKMLFFPNGDEVTKVSQFHKNSNSGKLSVWRNQSIGRYHLSRATLGSTDAMALSGR